jgi:hypothetical protein
VGGGHMTCRDGQPMGTARDKGWEVEKWVGNGDNGGVVAAGGPHGGMGS